MRLFDKYSAGVLRDPISAVSGGIGLVGNAVNGFLGKSAADKAGQLQQDAANAAAKDIKDTTASVNPAILDAAKQAGAGVTSTAQTAADSATASARAAAQGVNGAANSANAILDPYSEAGQAAAAQLKAGVAPGGQFNAQPTMKDIQIDPGYAFRLQQGQIALDRSAAARGGAISGAALKDTVNYSQGAASQEYQNAFNRFQTNRQNNYADILGISNQGQAAGIQQGNNLTAAARYGGDTGIQASEFGGALNTNAAQYAGTANINATDLTSSNTINAAKSAADYTTGGAAAKAAGIVGGANALTQGISGGANAASGAISLHQLLNNPATSGGGFVPYSQAKPFDPYAQYSGSNFPKIPGVNA